MDAQGEQADSPKETLDELLTRCDREKRGKTARQALANLNSRADNKAEHAKKWKASKFNEPGYRESWILDQMLAAFPPIEKPPAKDNDTDEFWQWLEASVEVPSASRQAEFEFAASHISTDLTDLNPAEIPSKIAVNLLREFRRVPESFLDNFRGSLGKEQKDEREILEDDGRVIDTTKQLLADPNWGEPVVSAAHA